MHFTMPRIGLAGLSMLVLLLAAATVGPATAHGVATGDQAYLENVNGMNIIPFMYLGAKHMVTGYDHLLFLFGVIFFLYRLKDVGLYVTLFAIGHSATLLFGVLNGTNVNAYLVDAIIGVSVIYKALDNLNVFKKWFGFQPNAKAAVLIFGLFHGFGLATKVREFELSPDGLVANILSFNVGVEIGQILALSAILIFMGFWRRTASFSKLAVAANVVLMLAGVALTITQLQGYFASTTTWKVPDVICPSLNETKPNLTQLECWMTTIQTAQKAIANAANVADVGSTVPHVQASTRGLLRSTVIATAVAGLLTVTCVLPAEYAIDPTGVGRIIGLTQMGEIKRDAEIKAAKPAKADLAAYVRFAGGSHIMNDTAPIGGAWAQLAQAAPAAAPAATAPAVAAPAAPAMKTDTKEVTIEPNSKMELKAWMKKGESYTFTWTASSDINYNQHGEKHNAPASEYTEYKKGVAKTDQGSFKANYDGTHGWSWRNRTKAPITIKATITGTYEKFSEKK